MESEAAQRSKLQTISNCIGSEERQKNLNAINNLLTYFKSEKGGNSQDSSKYN